MSAPENVNPTQFGRTQNSKDFTTGRRHVFHDIEVPNYQQYGHPSAVRASAQEHRHNDWTIDLTHGPFAEKDERGSYYKNIERVPYAGTAKGAEKKAQSMAVRSWKGLMKERPK